MPTILKIAKKQGILAEHNKINGQNPMKKFKAERNSTDFFTESQKPYRLLRASEDSFLRIAMTSLNNMD